MSETKHTPGPWHTAGDQGVQIRSQRDQIAKVWTMRGNEWKANARLIAAAPDLWEARKAVLANSLDSKGLANAHKQARDAIAKATAGV